MGDDDIRAALRRGDTNVAFRLLLEQHGPAIFSRCCRILKNQSAAEDMMQQAMISAFQHRSQLTQVDQIRGWLIRTATRKCLDALRSSKRVDRLHHGLHDTNGSESDDLFRKLASTQSRLALEGCMAALEPDLAAAVLMRYQDEMSWEQISEATGIPADTIRMSVRRVALPSLVKCLKSKDVTP